MRKVVLIFFLLYGTVPVFAENMLPKGDISNDELLETISKNAFLYFWNEANPRTGLAYDSMTNRAVSNASVGFSLASICVADFRKWITHEEALERVKLILNSAYDDPNDPNDFYMESVRGHPYHWTNALSGKWGGAEGICTHDTIAFFCGVLTVRKYFEGTEIEKLADKILDKVDWKWLADRSKDKKYVSNLYSPNNADWGGVLEYDGMKLDYLLPIGASKNPMDARFWDNWADSYQWKTYNGSFRHIARSALWIHQWDNCYADLYSLWDSNADYFQNSVEATLANRQWCIDNKMMDANAWGMNPTDGFAADGRPTYGDYGAPPAPKGSWQQGHVQDGTIAFTAAIPSIIFTPVESLAVARFMWNNLKEKMWKKYGFTCSFNLKTNRFSENYIGIDLGPVIINIENYRSGLIWKSFMKNEIVQQGLDRAGFVGIVDNFDSMEHSSPYGKWSATPGRKVKIEKTKNIKIDGEQSLSVTYNLDSGETFSLAVEPSLKNFSRYKVLGIWTKVISPSSIVLFDGKGKSAVCNFKSQIKNAGWILSYYQLPHGRVDMGSVKKVAVEFKPEHPSGTLFVDRVHITNIPVKKAPSRVIGLTASAGASQEGILLKWQQPDVQYDAGQGRIVRHVVAYSNRPIRTEDDFEKAGRVSEKVMKTSADRKEWECLIDAVIPGQNYYVAVRAEDVAFLRSQDFSVAEARAEKGAGLMGPGLLDGFENVSGWKSYAPEGTRLQIGSSPGKKGNALKLSYDLAATKSYVVAQKDFSLKLPGDYKLKFYLKGNGPKNNFEFKLVDKNGSNFWKKFEDLQLADQWNEIVLTRKDIAFAWGPSEVMDRIVRIELGVSAGAGGSGTVEIDELRVEY